MMEDPLMVQILPDHHRRSRWYTFTKPKSKSILLLIITITLGLLFVCYSNIELSSSRWNLTPGLSAYSDNPAADLVYFAKAFIPVGVLKVTDISQADGYCWYETVQEHILQVSRKDLMKVYMLGLLPIMHLVRLAVIRYKQQGLLNSEGLLHSAQVAFVSSEVVPPEFSRTISYVGVAYKIYSHSFLHYGQVKFFEEQRESICLLSDTAQEDLYESLQNSGLQAVASFAWPQGPAYNSTRKGMVNDLVLLKDTWPGKNH
uniref:Uncharacterized protein n=2 Tax=Brassica oleracea TaxID=3712 RepID=A0A0D3D578_BRAOL|nr:unnamed protein product [Brassica oleracea]